MYSIRRSKLNNQYKEYIYICVHKTDYNDSQLTRTAYTQQ